MEKETTMPVVNRHAAGIDVGSRSHFIAIGQRVEDVKEFAVSTDGHQGAIMFLKNNQITSIAMESTGSYWQTLFNVLQQAGFEVLLVPGNQTKNARGKTDVKDCQWIQKLHSLGLLTGSFLPDQTTEQLRTYCRQRTNMIDLAAEASNKMQKYLKLLNFRLDVVVNDICGLTGLSIIADICKGNLDPEKLSELRHGNCRTSQKEIAKALKGNNRTD